jgi:hypothetical protein
LIYGRATFNPEYFFVTIKIFVIVQLVGRGALVERLGGADEVKRRPMVFVTVKKA